MIAQAALRDLDRERRDRERIIEQRLAREGS